MNMLPREKRRGKTCIISLENKRNTDFKLLSEVAGGLASYGYYADKTARVAFNQPEEIVRALEDGTDCYENTVIICPKVMFTTVSDFFTDKFKLPFDALGIMDGADNRIFVMFSDSANRLRLTDIKNVLDKAYGIRYGSTVIREVGAPEELLQKAIDNAKRRTGDAYFNVTESYGDCRIEIVYSSNTSKMAIDDGVREIVSALNGYIYALEDISLAEQLVRLLKLRRMVISTAESFTGGGVGRRIVEVSGASEVFFEGLNTYSNKSKMGRLGVAELTLNQRGAVSSETAMQMADGLLKTGNCSVAVSTTGIAGPKSDNTSKPVGLAYIGVGVDGDVSVYKFNFRGDRRTITETAINHALFLTYKKLK